MKLRHCLLVIGCLAAATPSWAIDPPALEPTMDSSPPMATELSSADGEQIRKALLATIRDQTRAALGLSATNAVAQNSRSAPRWVIEIRSDGGAVLGTVAFSDAPGQHTSFSFHSDRGRVSVAGSVKDSVGRSYTLDGHAWVEFRNVDGTVTRIEGEHVVARWISGDGPDAYGVAATTDDHHHDH